VPERRHRAAIADAVLRGRPLIERIVTVTGRGVANPATSACCIGTPAADWSSLRPAATARGRPADHRWPDDGLSVSTATPCPSPRAATACWLPPRTRPGPGAASPVHPLRRVRQGLPGATAAAAALLACPRTGFRQGAGLSPVRLHRMRLLRVRLPGPYPAGAVLPLSPRPRSGRRSVNAKRPTIARQRHDAPEARLERLEAERKARLRKKKEALDQETGRVRQRSQEGRNRGRHEARRSEESGTAPKPQSDPDRLAGKD
jgi:electron transport complex protein RnfC